jgi:hypothetical protein
MKVGSRIFAVSGWFLIVIAVLAAASFGFFAVLLRDGLGPDSIPSHGALAFWRAFEGFAVPGALSVGVFCAGIAFVRRAKRGVSNA